MGKCQRTCICQPCATALQIVENPRRTQEFIVENRLESGVSLS